MMKSRFAAASTAAAAAAPRFRVVQNPTYGNVGLSFDAKTAQSVGETRDKRYQEIYDRILLRCLDQITKECETKKSTIFKVPDSLGTELTRYNVDDVTQYLLIALGIDRGYTVIRIGPDLIYVRWTPPTGEEEKQIAAPQMIIQPPDRSKNNQSASSLIVRHALKRHSAPSKSRNSSSGSGSKSSSSSVPVNPQKTMSEINQILASLGK